VRCSPDASSPASDSPTPTNSIQDRNWAWQGLVSEEQRQLLEESSDRHSSDEDTEVSSEVWLITPEQKDYYTKQFQILQENTNSLLAGTDARHFFERLVAETVLFCVNWVFGLTTGLNCPLMS